MLQQNMKKHFVELNVIIDRIRNPFTAPAQIETVSFLGPECDKPIDLTFYRMLSFIMRSRSVILDPDLI